MEVITYNNYDSILIKFEKGDPVHTQWKNFIKGNVRNVYDKSVFGIGFLGEGEYKTWENNRYTPQYIKWKGILERSYSDKHKIRFPTYIGVTVCDEWHNFQNFAKWYDENYYEIDNEVMCLDKDILIKGNKIYSPETCVIAPARINNLFIKNDANRGNLPVGVSLCKSRKNRYGVKCSDGNKGDVNLGYFKTPEDAFNTYKIYKEKLIKQFAEEYKDKIPLRLYKAMITYEVEITD
jgi:hypothetical protein